MALTFLASKHLAAFGNSYPACNKFLGHMEIQPGILAGFLFGVNLNRQAAAAGFNVPGNAMGNSDFV